MFKSSVLVVIGAIALSSCASKVHRGVVAMKINDSTAHVGLNKDEVKVGDHVELYANKCQRSRQDDNKPCQKVLKGHGTVTEIVNENYAAVQFDTGVNFTEGEFVEKHTH